MKRFCVLLVIALGLTLTVFAFSTTCVSAQTFKPITLKFADAVTQGSWYGQQHQWWANEVEKRTGGRVKVQIFWMESLVKWKDMLQGIQSGIADLGWFSSTYNPSNVPLFLMLDNPLNCQPGHYVAAILAVNDTMDNQPDLRAELERENIIMVANHNSGMAQIGSKKCPNSLKDLKGKSIRSYGGGQIKTYENLGMNPTFISYSDIYEAIDRGTVDLSNIAVTLSDAFKHYEVMKCVYMTNGGAAIASGIFLNRKIFKKFPRDIQEIFLKLRTEYGIRYGKGVEDGETTVREKWTTKYGVTFKELSPEDRKIFQEASDKATEYLLKKQEADGHTAARKVWNYYLNALKKYEKQGW